jgi:hypothetical protein
VLHRIGLRFGVEHGHLSPRLGLLHVTRLLSFGLELRGSDHLLFDFHLDRQPIVFLRLDQKPFQPFGVLRRQRHVAQHDLLDDNPVRRQAPGDGISRHSAHLLAFR